MSTAGMRQAGSRRSLGTTSTRSLVLTRCGGSTVALPAPGAWTAPPPARGRPSVRSDGDEKPGDVLGRGAGAPGY